MRFGWLVGVLCVGAAHAGDWPGWGYDNGRNMASPDKTVPKKFSFGSFVAGTDAIDLASTKGVRWVSKLGSQTYGNPTVAGGKVFVGTNNEGGFRPGFVGDGAVVLAFDEADGRLLWQLSVPKMGSGKVNDWEYLGICSAPVVVGQVAYVVSNRGEIVALDVDGLANGNDGMTDEIGFMQSPMGGGPTELVPLDADILWTYDMPTELGVFPHNASSNSVLVIGDNLYVATSNGVDWSHIDMPAPFAPTFIGLNRHTGALIGEEAIGLSERTLHANWSSLAMAPKNDKHPAQLIFGAGDGYLYGFDVDPVDDRGLKVFQERWRVDANAPSYRELDGVPRIYPEFEGPSEIIATPVYHEGLVYVAIGQDPEHGPGVGRLIAVDPSGSGDFTGKEVWAYEALGRSISTASVVDGIVYLSDYDGKIHALDARTGEVLWTHETHGHVWGSTFVAGGRVFLGNEDGIFVVFKAGRKKKLLMETQLPAPVYSTPVLANGTLYIASQTHLYAIDGK